MTSNEDLYLASIANGEGPIPPVPTNAEEQYLQYIATGEGELPKVPTNFKEAMLAKIAENGGGGGGGGMTQAIEQALLACFENVAWANENGQTYYNALCDALDPSVTLVSIAAVFTQGQNVIYDEDDLDTLKQYLVVTANMSDGSVRTLSNSAYGLSGTLTAGTCVITVSYRGETTTFNVAVTLNTNPKIEYEDYILTHHSTAPEYRRTAMLNGCITIQYTMDAPTNILYPAGIIPTTGNTVIASSGASVVAYDGNGEVSYANEVSRWAQEQSGTMTEFSNSWTLQRNYTKIAFSLDKRYLDRAYMYDKTTGQIWFAGENTPYFGMSNISEASS